MRFAAKSEEEVQRAGLMPDGTYDFTVISAEDTVSKKGNPMMKVKLQVFADKERQITDYLLEAFAFKLRHFCYSIGFGQAYEAGELAAENVVGASGKVIIETEQQEGFGVKNIVADYACQESATQAKAAERPTATQKAIAQGSGKVEDEPPF